MTDTIAQGVLPFTAAFVTTEAGLPEVERVLYTAAALACPNVLGLAPALVAAQNADRVIDKAGLSRSRPVPGDTMVDLPNVEGMGEDEAVRLLKERGLRARVRHVTYHKAKGKVIEQLPEANHTIVRRGTVVRLTVSDGPADTPRDPFEERFIALFNKAFDAREAQKAAKAQTTRTTGSSARQTQTAAPSAAPAGTAESE